MHNVVALRSPLVLLALVAGAAASACGTPAPAVTSPMAVTTTSASVSSLSRYKTYSHATPLEAPEGPLQPLPPSGVLTKVRRDVDVQLQSRGYKMLPDGGELIVQTSVDGTTVVVDVMDRNSGSQLVHGVVNDAILGDSLDDQRVFGGVSAIFTGAPPARH